MASEYIQSQTQQAAQRFFASPEAEENILRRMIAKPEAAEDISEALSGKDFADVDNGRLFCAIRDCMERGVQVDCMSVDDTFTRMFPKHEKRLRERLIEYASFKPYTLHDGQGVADVVALVKGLAERRRTIRRMEEAVKALRDPSKDMAETMADVTEAADGGEADECEWVPLSDVNLAAYEYMEKRQKGEIRAIPSGIKSLDEIMGGLFQGELTVVAARPGVGKSAFGLNLAMVAAKDGFKVGFVSCEMDDLGFGQRTLSRGAFVDGDRLRKAKIRDEDWDKLAYAMADMDGLPVHFLFNDSKKGFAITVESVFRSVKRRARRGEIDLLVVDYIGIMRTVKVFKEERLRIAHISAELKRLAMAARIPVVALCQVNRMAQGRMPTLAELRDSGAIEQDADVIAFIHRPEDAEDRSVHPRDRASFFAMQDGGVAYIAINVAKQRNGCTGITQVMFDPGVMRYNEIMRDAT